MTQYTIKYTNQFKKDYKLAQKRGLNIQLLKDIVSKLANKEPLDEKKQRPCTFWKLCRLPGMSYSSGLAFNLSNRRRCFSIDLNPHRFSQ